MERNIVIFFWLIAFLVATIGCSEKKGNGGSGANLLERLRLGTAIPEHMLESFASLSTQDKEYVILNVDCTIAEEFLSNIPRNYDIDQVSSKLSLTEPQGR